jgi:hypothetical protein
MRSAVQPTTLFTRDSIMKCKFVLDVDVDVRKLATAQKSQIRWRAGVNKFTGKTRREAYFAAGTEYDHPNAAFFVNHGMAVPADDDCEAACDQITPEQRDELELSYKATSLGIHDEHDRDLFFGGVIAGYERVKGKLAYLPGPNWAQWDQEQQAAAAVPESDV